MPLAYYKLKEQPFGVTPDPRYLYLGTTHREALASVKYGYKANRGFTALVAPPGMGKTTLLFSLLEEWKHSARTVFLFHPQYSPHGLLQSILADLDIDTSQCNLVSMHNRLNEFLVRESEAGRRVVVVIDEAQNLRETVLEALRMLSNFETPREKLLHIVLAGQPQLAERLASPKLVQLRQRVSILAKLAPFDGTETHTYIEHRLRLAGYSGELPLFTPAATAMIARSSGGIPRNINNICFNALTLGCVLKHAQMDTDVIEEVLRDLALAPLFEVPAEAASEPRVIAPPAGRSTPPAVESARARWPVMAGVAACLLALLLWPFLRATGRIPFLSPLAGAVASQPKPSTVSSPTNAEISSAASSPVVVRQSPAIDLPEAVRTPVGAIVLPVPAAPQEEANVVRIEPNETVSDLSMKTFGKYNQQVAGKLRELNPWLVDPDTIRAGQTIRIPKSKEAIRKMESSSRDDSGIPNAKVEKR